MRLKKIQCISKVMWNTKKAIHLLSNIVFHAFYSLSCVFLPAEFCHIFSFGFFFFLKVFLLKYFLSPLGFLFSCGKSKLVLFFNSILFFVCHLTTPNFFLAKQAFQFLMSVVHLFLQIHPTNTTHTSTQSIIYCQFSEYNFPKCKSSKRPCIYAATKTYLISVSDS